MLHGRRLALAVVLLVFLAESATALVVPLLIGRIIDQLTLNGVSQLPDGFLYMGAAILCAALAAGLFAWVGGVGISRITERSEERRVGKESRCRWRRSSGRRQAAK